MAYLQLRATFYFSDFTIGLIRHMCEKQMFKYVFNLGFKCWFAKQQCIRYNISIVTTDKRFFSTSKSRISN